MSNCERTEADRLPRSPVGYCVMAARPRRRVMTYDANPFLFSVSGPYGVGKDSLINELQRQYVGKTHRVRALTTRAVTSAADPWYENTSEEELAIRTAHGRWIVNRQMDGAVAYATSIDEIESAHHAGIICIQSIFAGPDGAGRLREIFGKAVLSVGLVAASGSLDEQLAVLRQRLTKRGREDTDAIDHRLKHQHQTIQYIQDNPLVKTPNGPLRVFDDIVTNDDFEAALARLRQLFSRLTAHL